VKIKFLVLFIISVFIISCGNSKEQIHGDPAEQNKESKVQAVSAETEEYAAAVIPECLVYKFENEHKPMHSIFIDIKNREITKIDYEYEFINNEGIYYNYDYKENRTVYRITGIRRTDTEIIISTETEDFTYNFLESSLNRRYYPADSMQHSEVAYYQNAFVETCIDFPADIAVKAAASRLLSRYCSRQAGLKLYWVYREGKYQLYIRYSSGGYFRFYRVDEVAENTEDCIIFKVVSNELYDYMYIRYIFTLQAGVLYEIYTNDFHGEFSECW
jgi:hypothetical protein